MIPAVAAPSIDITSLNVPIIGSGDLVTVLIRLLGIFLLWAGIIAFLFVLYGGFLYLTAGGDTAKTVQARSTILNAVIGILIIFFSYAIVQGVINEIQNAKLNAPTTTKTTPKP